MSIFVKKILKIPFYTRLPFQKTKIIFKKKKKKSEKNLTIRNEIK